MERLLKLLDEMGESKPEELGSLSYHDGWNDAIRCIRIKIIEIKSTYWMEFFTKEELKDFGSIIKTLRKKQKWTQEELAQKTGIPQSHISEYERNLKKMGIEISKKFGKAFNLSYKVFL